MLTISPKKRGTPWLVECDTHGLVGSQSNRDLAAQRAMLHADETDCAEVGYFINPGNGRWFVRTENNPILEPVAIVATRKKAMEAARVHLATFVLDKPEGWGFCSNRQCACWRDEGEPCDDFAECHHPFGRCACCGRQKSAHKVAA